MTDPMLLASDVHLSHLASPAPANDLARLVREHAGHEIVLAGDIFDLSHDRPSIDPAASAASLLERHTALRTALRSHLVQGGAVTFIAGNHDAPIGAAALRERMLSVLDVTTGARLEHCPWFVRRAGTHIEHGHVYDPDNAPTHPLALGSAATEPLGIQLTRRFLVPSGAWDFAHAHETTPLGGLARAFRLYGRRAPRVVARYFATSIPLCARAGRSARFEPELRRGSAAIADFANGTGLESDVVRRLTALGAQPTLHSFRGTFMRLYFDRIFATLAFVSGASAALAGRTSGAGVAAASAAYLSASLRRSGSRYSGRVEERLRDAAAAVAALSGANLVVFGHSHIEDEASGYLNLGSFAYAGEKGRPYAVIVDGRIERRHLRA